MYSRTSDANMYISYDMFSSAASQMNLGFCQYRILWLFYGYTFWSLPQFYKEICFLRRNNPSEIGYTLLWYFHVCLPVLWGKGTGSDQNLFQLTKLVGKLMSDLYFVTEIICFQMNRSQFKKGEGDPLTCPFALNLLL